MELKILWSGGLCLPLVNSRTIEPEVPQQLQCVFPTRPVCGGGGEKRGGRGEKKRNGDKIPYILFKPVGI